MLRVADIGFLDHAHCDKSPSILDQFTCKKLYCLYIAACQTTRILLKLLPRVSHTS